MNVLGPFLSACHSVHASGAGTVETSYYTAVNQLLDSVGAQLSPKVRCIMQLKNLGAGNPDGGLFTADQFHARGGQAKDLSAPARGVIEVKSPGEPLHLTSKSLQVDKYWQRYKLVLVTNLRDWLLIGERQGQRVALERYTLAEDEASFWHDIAAHPQRSEKLHGQAFTDFVQRVLLHKAPLAEPRDLAALLASYARQARHRVENASPGAAKQLSSLQDSLESALGLRFESGEGAHFFRSTLVQTLFYGVFSAWVLRHEEDSAHGPFDWRSAAHSLNVPMIAALFGQLSQPAKLKALGLTEVLDWTADALNRVDTAAFFKAFESTRSIQYFYEPFLAAFDPELRKKLGVWYTPEDIVRYQVARVDQVLQTELGLPQGLADPDVVVLDPCCGTGAYLVEVLRLIGDKLKAQGADALAAHQIKQAATTRLFGFELLPAPYVVAHLQIGLLLRQWGTPLSDDERAGIYLTNALTGWEPPKEPKNTVLPFPEFEQERDAADQVKQQQKIIVILGNPPYDGFAGVAVGEEQDLVATYKEGLRTKWGIKKYNLDDLYVRFFRLAERRIAEKGTGRGVVSFISNYSWTTEPSFVVMREKLLMHFNKLWIENMHGNRNISEYAPDGRTSETVFAQTGFSPGIKQGVVISTWVRNAPVTEAAEILYCDGFNQARATDRRGALLASLGHPNRHDLYARSTPNRQNKLSFRPQNVDETFASWPTVKDLAGEAPINGLMEKRGGALIDCDQKLLAKRVQAYFDSAVSNAELALMHSGLTTDAARYKATSTRAKHIAASTFNSSNLVRYALRPFDTRYAYVSLMRPLWNEPRPTLWAQHVPGNRYLGIRPKAVADTEGSPFMCTRALGDNDAMRGHAYFVPLTWHETSNATPPMDDLFGSTAPSTPTTRANLSPIARNYLAALGLPDPDQDSPTAELLWMHALAIGYSPAYLADNADGIAQDWPRIPLPASRDALLASAALGRRVAALLDTEAEVPGVTSGSIPPELQAIAVVSREGGGPLQSEEFALTAGWGSAGKAGVTMPGRGRSQQRAATPAERAGGWGPLTLDVYLNEKAFWKNIPPAVWDFHIGGYQVIKKWLSYREHRLLGRALHLEEIKEVTHTARRLAALVLLQTDLDANYYAAAGDTWVAPTAP
jgi:hypothetical protein